MEHGNYHIKWLPCLVYDSKGEGLLSLFLLFYDGINHGHGGDVDDVAYRGLPVGEVDGLVQSHLDGAYDFVGIAQTLEELVSLVGTREVGEYERVHLLALKLVERELLVAQLTIEGKLDLHLAIEVPLGILAMEIFYRFGRETMP